MKKQILFLVFLFAIVNVNAQRIKIAEGDLSALKGVKEYNVVFDYSNIEIINFDSEEAFLKAKSELRDKKSEGSGEIFRKLWFNNRDELYNPSFIKYFNKYSKKIVLHTDKPDLKYTIKVCSEKMYSGYNVGIWKEESKLFARIIIYETANPENIIASTNQVLKKGLASYDNWERIASSYSKLGKSFAFFLSKKTK